MEQEDAQQRQRQQKREMKVDIHGHDMQAKRRKENGEMDVDDFGMYGTKRANEDILEESEIKGQNAKKNQTQNRQAVKLSC
jgi:hypothetical protein